MMKPSNNEGKKSKENKKKHVHLIHRKQEKYFYRTLSVKNLQIHCRKETK